MPSNYLHSFTPNNYTLSKHAHLMSSKKLTECPYKCSETYSHAHRNEVKQNDSLSEKIRNSEKVRKVTKTQLVNHNESGLC